MTNIPVNVFKALSSTFTGINWPTIISTHVNDTVEFEIVYDTRTYYARLSFVGGYVRAEYLSQGQWLLIGKHDVAHAKATFSELNKFVFGPTIILLQRYFLELGGTDTISMHDEYMTQVYDEYNPDNSRTSHLPKLAFSNNLWRASMAFKGGLTGRPCWVWLRKLNARMDAIWPIRKAYYGLFKARYDGELMPEDLALVLDAPYQSDYLQTWKLYWLHTDPMGRASIDRAIAASPTFRRSLMNMPKGKLPKNFNLGTVAELALQLDLHQKFPSNRNFWIALSAISRSGAKQEMYEAITRTDQDQWRKLCADHGLKLSNTAHLFNVVHDIADAGIEIHDNATMIALDERAKIWHRNNHWVSTEVSVPDDAQVIAPPIPLPGFDGLSLLSTAGEMRDEGTRMDHCIGLYVKEAIRGTAYFFHLDFEGQMASAEVSATGRYVIQSRGQHNIDNKASAKLASILTEWAQDLPADVSIRPNTEPEHVLPFAVNDIDEALFAL